MSTELPFQVECKSTQAFFEPIAAFNHIKVAYRYAQDCLETNLSSGFEYRLRDTESDTTYSVRLYKGWGAAA